jgi:hypothetical protein
MTIRRIVPALILAFSVLLVFSANAPVVQGQAKEPGTVILKGAPIGGVKFEHKLHAHDRKIKCETCHHPSKPQKAAKAANQKCTDCHTKVAAAPMKTKLQAAFHDPMAKKGVCVDCHLDGVKKGTAKKAPAKCADCHKKENV